MATFQNNYYNSEEPLQETFHQRSNLHARGRFQVFPKFFDSGTIKQYFFMQRPSTM